MCWGGLFLVFPGWIGTRSRSARTGRPTVAIAPEVCTKHRWLTRHTKEIQYRCLLPVFKKTRLVHLQR